MARLRSGILGQLRGKVAGVVGSQWKDKNYIREYVLPANPNTLSQQAQRSKMTKAVAFAKPLVGPIFNPYTDKFQKSMSGFNRFIKSNIVIFDASPDLTAIVITEGKLSPILTTDTVYNTATGDCTVTWTENKGNNGASDDMIYGAIYHEPTGIWYAMPMEKERSDLSILYILPTGLTATDLSSYTFAIQYSGTLVNMISNSDYQVGEAP